MPKPAGGYGRRQRCNQTEGDRMKTMLRRLLILAAPFVWRKIKERRRRGR